MTHDLHTLASEFARDGAVCVRGLVAAELLAKVTAAVDANLAAPSVLAQVASQANDPGRFVEDFCNWPRFPAYVDLAQATAPVAQALMGSASVRLYHDHLLVKEAGTRQPTPWHQDQPYYDVDGRTWSACGCPSTRCHARARSNSSPAPTSARG